MRTPKKGATREGSAAMREKGQWPTSRPRSTWLSGSPLSSQKRGEDAEDEDAEEEEDDDIRRARRRSIGVRRAAAGEALRSAQS